MLYSAWGCDMKFKKKSIYCSSCRNIINSICRPSQKDWQDFKDCRCLTNNQSEKLKKIHFKQSTKYLGGKNGANI